MRPCTVHVWGRKWGEGGRAGGAERQGDQLHTYVDIPLDWVSVIMAKR